MKTYIVSVTQPKPRGRAHISRGVVAAESYEQAIQTARDYYPPTVTGWPKDSTFSAIEVPPGKMVSV